jgi:hypothetical protein
LQFSGRRHTLRVSVLFVTASWAIGCAPETGPIAQEQTNLAWLGSMYGMYIGAHQGQPPQSVDELRKFVTERTDAAELSRLKVSDVKQLFTSPRDGKPFVMVNHKKLPPREGGQPPPVVLYEAVGEGGERAVAFLGGGTQVVNESELTKLLPAASGAR